MHDPVCIVGAQQSQFHRDYTRTPFTEKWLSYQSGNKPKKKSVDEIMTVPAMENRSTEAMLGHCVTSIFFASTRSER